MTILVQAPNGANVEFPDGTDPKDIERIMREQLGGPPEVEGVDRDLRRGINNVSAGLLNIPADAARAGTRALMGENPVEAYRNERAKTNRAISGEEGLNARDVTLDTAGNLLGVYATAPLTMARNVGELGMTGLRAGQEQLARVFKPAVNEVDNVLTKAAARKLVAKESTRVGAAYGTAGGYASSPDDASLPETLGHMAEHTAGGAILGRAIPAAVNLFGDYVSGPIRNFLNSRKAARAEYANRVAGDFQAADVTEFPPALSNSDTVQGTARGLSTNIAGGPIREPARRSIQDIEGNVNAAIGEASGGRMPAEQGERLQNFLEQQLVDRSMPKAEVEAMTPQRLQDISGVRPSPDFNPEPPRVARAAPREIPPVSPEQHLDEVAAGVEPVKPRAALDIEERYKPPKVEDVELSDDLVKKVGKAAANVADLQRRLQAEQAAYRAVEEPLAAEMHDKYGIQSLKWLDNIKGFYGKRRVTGLTNEAGQPLPDQYRDVIINHDGTFRGQQPQSQEEADFFKRLANWLKVQGEHQGNLEKTQTALEKAVHERDIVAREADAFRTEQLPVLAQQRRADATKEATGAAEAEAALATQRARQEARDRAFPTAQQDAMQKTNAARQAEADRVADYNARRQEASDAAFREDLEQRRNRPLEPFNPDTSGQSYPTTFDAAYAAVREGAPDVRQNMLGRRATQDTAEVRTNTTALLADMADEARANQQLPGHKGLIFDPKGGLRQDFVDYLEPLLGKGITDRLRYFSDRRAGNQASVGLEGMLNLRTALREAAEDADRAAGMPGNTRTESGAMLTRLRGAVDRDIRAFAMGDGSPAQVARGEQFLRQLDMIDRAYASYMQDLRGPLAKLFDKQDSVQALSTLVRDTQEGGNIDRLRAFYRVVDAKGGSATNRMSATAALLHNMMEDGLAGFLKNWRGLTEDAKALMFSGASRPLGEALERQARVGGYMERYLKAAGDQNFDLTQLARPGNLALGVTYYFGLPATISAALGVSTAAKLMGSKWFAGWLKQFPIEKGPGSPEVAKHIARLRGYAMESLGLNDATAGKLEDMVGAKQAKAAGPASSGGSEQEQEDPVAQFESAAKAEQHAYRAMRSGSGAEEDYKAAQSKLQDLMRAVPRLSKADRDALDDDQFGLPKERQYPIHDKMTAAVSKYWAVRNYAAGKLTRDQMVEIYDRANQVLKAKPSDGRARLGGPTFSADPRPGKVPVGEPGWGPSDLPQSYEGTLLNDAGGDDQGLTREPPQSDYPNARVLQPEHTQEQAPLQGYQRASLRDNPERGGAAGKSGNQRFAPWYTAEGAKRAGALVIAPVVGAMKALPYAYDLADEFMSHGYQPGENDTQGVDNAAKAALAVTGGSTAFPRPSGSLGIGGRPWTAEQKALLADGLRKGKTPDAIAEELGRSRASVNQATSKFRDELDLPHRRDQWSEASKQELAESYNRGDSIKQIARDFGTSPDSIRSAVAQYRDELKLQRRRSNVLADHLEDRDAR